MALATIRQPCIKCDKGLGITTCGGCQQCFCTKHFIEHRQELETEMDHIGQEYDVLQKDLTKENSEHPLLSHINNWEQKSIKKIQKVAEEIRINLRKHLDNTKNELKTSLDQLTKNFQSNRETDDYTEIELKKWIEQLKELRQKLEKPPTLEIIDDDSTPSIIRLIQLREHQTMIETIKSRSSFSFSLRKQETLLYRPYQQEKHCLRSFSLISINMISHHKSSFILIPRINVNPRWILNGVTVAGGHGDGKKLNQLSFPQGLYVDDEQTIFIADHRNYRIVEWKCGATIGQVVAGGNGHGTRIDQLSWPRDVIVDKETNSLIINDSWNRRVMRWPRRSGTSGKIIISNIDCWGLTMDDRRSLYVCDWQKHEVRRYRMGETGGTVVAGGNGKGDRLNQLHEPVSVFVDRDYSVYVSDYGNHRVVKWIKDTKEGIVVAGGQGKGNSLTQLYYPTGLVVDSLGTVYVADQWNHRVMRWCNGAIQGSVIVGGNGPGAQANQLNCPQGLSFDRQGNVYVVDHGNHQIQRFNIE